MSKRGGAASQRKALPQKRQTNHKPSWSRLALALTLVPLIAGVLFIAMWALDFYLWEPGENQAMIGLLFILLSFALSNAVQRNWILATGWGLLTVADLLLLVVVSLPVQIAAIAAVVIGLGLLLFEFYRRFQQQNQKPQKQKR